MDTLHINSVLIGFVIGIAVTVLSPRLYKVCMAFVAWVRKSGA